jgi:hypothetical protein
MAADEAVGDGWGRGDAGVAYAEPFDVKDEGLGLEDCKWVLIEVVRFQV